MHESGQLRIHEIEADGQGGLTARSRGIGSAIYGRSSKESVPVRIFADASGSWERKKDKIHKLSD